MNQNNKNLIGILLSTLGASLLGSMFAGKGVIQVGDEVFLAGEGQDA